MNFSKTILAAACFVVAAAAHAQQQPATPAGEGPPKLAPGQAGVDRMKAIMDAMKTGDSSKLPGSTQQGIQSGLTSGEKAGDFKNAPQSTIDLAIRANEEWQQMSKEAYVAALPPRDRPRGQALLLGDGTLPGYEGKLYIFVSRSMPMSMLRAYALDALYTGATLVTKGIRKGDTIKEYVEESVNDYNNAEGQVLAGLEINPNLFDMFRVDVVPAVVWTNRVGLEDVGAGCQPLPEGAPVPQMEVTGPEGRPILMDRPACTPASPTSYYKLTGALTMPYVLDRFEEAGLSKEATAQYRQALSERRAGAFHAEAQAPVGNGLQPITGDIRIENMPRRVLQGWKEMMATSNVQRGPYGPSFSEEGEDDPIYRQELGEKIRHGLGL